MLEEQEVCSERCGGALGDGDSDGDGCDGVEKVEESCVYHVALEARVMGGGGGGEEERTRAVGFEVSLAEATFTQIDIKHPNEFNPTSTPSANHGACASHTYTHTHTHKTLKFTTHTHACMPHSHVHVHTQNPTTKKTICRRYSQLHCCRREEAGERLQSLHHH